MTEEPEAAARWCDEDEFLELLPKEEPFHRYPFWTAAIAPVEGEEGAAAIYLGGDLIGGGGPAFLVRNDSGEQTIVDEGSYYHGEGWRWSISGSRVELFRDGKPQFELADPPEHDEREGPVGLSRLFGIVTSFKYMEKEAQDAFESLIQGETRLSDVPHDTLDSLQFWLESVGDVSESAAWFASMIDEHVGDEEIAAYLARVSERRSKRNGH